MQSLVDKRMESFEVEREKAIVKEKRQGSDFYGS